MKPLGPSDPRQIGPYRVFGELGRGGMGRVLLAGGRDGRLVALKLVHVHHVEDPGFRERFRREVNASRRVSGAYTAAVVDADSEAALPWLATVFVPGPSLRQAVEAAGPLPPQAALRLAAGLAAALGEIHAAGLVHRDLKPSNVLLAADGARVIDFGVARATDLGTSELTHTGSLVGSPGYMSPEQAQSRSVTPASDVFALGAMLYLASTGVDPFLGDSTPATLYNVVHSEPGLEPVPQPLRGIVEACIAKDPNARPTPGEVLARIGTVPPSARAWPDPVHTLIAQQDEAVAAALRVADPANALQETTTLMGPSQLGTRVPTQAAESPLAARGPSSSRPESPTTHHPSQAPEASATPGVGRRRAIASFSAVAVVAVLGASVALLTQRSGGSPSTNPSVSALGVASSSDDTPSRSSSPEPSTTGSPTGRATTSGSLAPPPSSITTSTLGRQPACLTDQQAYNLAKARNSGEYPPDASISVLTCDSGWATARLNSPSVGYAKAVYQVLGGSWKAVDLGSDVCGGPVAFAPADVRHSVGC